MSLLSITLVHRYTCGCSSRAALSQCVSHLRATHHLTDTLRNEYVALRDSYQRSMQTWKSYLKTAEHALQHGPT
jgi:hypothetical protein